MDYSALKDIYGKKSAEETSETAGETEDDSAQLSACREGIAKRVQGVTEEEVEELVQLLKVRIIPYLS